MDEKRYSVEITVRKEEARYLKACALLLAEKLFIDDGSSKEVINGVSVKCYYDDPIYLFWLGYILRARVDNEKNRSINS